MPGASAAASSLTRSPNNSAICTAPVPPADASAAAAAPSPERITSDAGSKAGSTSAWIAAAPSMALARPTT
jgi:hypothetical protein